MPLKVGLREGLGDICEGLQFPLSLHSASSPFNTHAKTQRQTSPYTYPKGRAETGLLGNTLFRNLIPGSGSEGRAEGERVMSRYLTLWTSAWVTSCPSSPGFLRRLVNLFIEPPALGKGRGEYMSITSTYCDWWHQLPCPSRLHACDTY